MESPPLIESSSSSTDDQLETRASVEAAAMAQKMRESLSQVTTLISSLSVSEKPASKVTPPINETRFERAFNAITPSPTFSIGFQRVPGTSDAYAVDNKLVGILTACCDENAEEGIHIATRLLPESIRDEFRRIGTSLPYLLVSFFLDEEHMTMLDESEIQPVWYNTDVDLAQKYMAVDDTKSKVAFHPYVFCIDKFSFAFLKTFHWFPLFSPHITSPTAVPDTSVAVALNMLLLMEPFPPGHSLHEEIAEERARILQLTYQALDARLQKGKNEELQIQ